MENFYSHCLINKADVFVREPVDQEINEILSSKKRRFILAGSHGSGRSVILREMEKRSLGTKEPTIYNTPAEMVKIGKYPSLFTDDIFDKYFELQLAKEIIEYIKKYYPLLFQEHFKDDWELAKELSRNINEDYNNVGFLKDGKLEIDCNTHQLLIESIEKFIDKKGLKKLNIAFDDFDHVNGGSTYTQIIYERYFSVFDKVIITADDPTLDKSKKDILKENGYQIKEITYGSNKDVLKEIINRRIIYNNDHAISPNDRMDGAFFTQDIIINYLSELGNNINITLKVLSELNDEIKYYSEEYISNNIYELLDSATRRAIKKSTNTLSLGHRLYIPQKNSNI